MNKVHRTYYIITQLTEVIKESHFLMNQSNKYNMHMSIKQFEIKSLSTHNNHEVLIF